MVELQDWLAQFERYDRAPDVHCNTPRAISLGPSIGRVDVSGAPRVGFGAILNVHRISAVITLRYKH